MTWDGVLGLHGDSLDELANRYGGRVTSGGSERPRALAPVETARVGQLAPLTSGRFVRAGREAADRGAALLVQPALSRELGQSRGVWVHEHAAWVLAALLDEVTVPDLEAAVGLECSIAPSAVLGPRVSLGMRVTIGAGAVIGHPGFGWVRAPGGAFRAIPQLAGVVIEDDVSIGPLCTVDSGTLAPTRIRSGVKLDAHVHVGHNADIGEGTLVAAQCGLAGSVKIGRGVLVGGQAGFADHVVVGDRARIAAKSGVIGDVPPGVTVAGYPAMPRVRWLRALAKLYAGVRDVG